MIEPMLKRGCISKHRKLIAIYLLLFIFFLNNNTSAQSKRLSVDLGGGPMYYSGELQKFSIISKPELTHPCMVAGVNIQLFQPLRLKIEYVKGSVSGADSLTWVSSDNDRNLDFKTNIEAFNLSTEISLFNFSERFMVTPYVFAGIGIFHFNPKTKLGNEWYYLQQLGTEGQYIEPNDNNEPYKLWQLHFPIGIGLRCKLSKTIGVKLEGTFHKTTTDYIDDVSGNYPDMRALSQTSNGDLAVALSNRSGTSVDESIARGNPKTVDGIIHFNISLNVSLQAFDKKNKVYKKPKYTSTVRKSNKISLPSDIWTY